MDEDERIEALRRLKEELARENERCEAVSAASAWRALAEIISNEIAPGRQN